MEGSYHWSSLENYTSNNTSTTRDNTRQDKYNTTQHEYSTRRHDTTRDKTSTTQEQQKAIRVQHETTRVQNNIKLIFIFLYHHCILGTWYIRLYSSVYIVKLKKLKISCEYFEISKNTYFEEHLRLAASEVTFGSDCSGLSFWTVAFKKPSWLSSFTKIPVAFKPEL